MPEDAVDKDLIRELADLLSETNLSEIEIEREGLRIRVARQNAVIATAPAPSHAAVQARAGPESGAPEASVHPGTVPSPMVGTVYVSPEPGADPFIKVGDTVSEGETLFIVEAMKVMNPISAPRSGIVRQILIEDGQPVEFGEPLAIIE